MSVLLETSYGDIVIDVYPEFAPTACMNFIKLCSIKYYNDCEFFRVQKGFIAQTGDPTNTGSGGASVFARCTPPGRKFFGPERAAGAKHSKKGTVSMVGSETAIVDGKKGHGSQFFVTLSDGLNYLDAEHTVFGHIAEGMNVVDKIGEALVDDKFQPYRLIRIRHTIILHDPFDDPDGLPTDCASPEPAQGSRGDRLGSDEDEDEDRDENDEERRNRIQHAEDEREARSRAEVLEMIGDIGDADLKPPENVLFICKLNPVTEAEDLEIIFSRFGECKADILRDRSSGASLCYGFIEFDNKSQCESAYFKMDGALIDDRRIRVDFSQSVSKLWNDARRTRAPTPLSLKRKNPQGQGFSKRHRPSNSRNVQASEDGHNRDRTLQNELPHLPQEDLRPEALNSRTALPAQPRTRRSRFDVRPSKIS